MPDFASVSLTRHSLPLRTPLETGRQTITSRDVAIVRLQLDGTTGMGEAAPLFGFDCEEVDASVDAIYASQQRLAGVRAPSSRDDVIEIVESLELGATPCARAALETALCDIAAKRANKPLARFLCSAAVGAVPLNALVHDVSGVSAALGAGFQTLKVKMRSERDLVRIEAVRHAAPTVALRVDANGSIAAAALGEVVERLATLNLEYVEELTTPGPVPVSFPNRAERIIRIAADESVATLTPEALIERVDVVVLKPSLLGGPLSTLRRARALEKTGLACVITSSIESAIGLRAALATAAALYARSGHRLAAGLATSNLLAHDLAVAPRIEQGAMRIDDSPGLGISVAP